MSTRSSPSLPSFARPRAVAAVLGLAALWCSLPAHAGGVLVAPCGDPVEFAADVSTVVHCSIGTTADNAIGGSSAVAGLDHFENHISPVHFYGDSDAFAGSATWVVTSSPSWSAGVTSVPTLLELDGAVKLQGPGSSLTITLTGLLGGPALVITKSFAWSGAPQEFLLAERLVGDQAVAGQAIETLTIAITGRARYDVDGSPVFAGAVPEPHTWAMLLSGLLLAGGAAWRRRGRP